MAGSLWGDTAAQCRAEPQAAGKRGGWAGGVAAEQCMGRWEEGASLRRKNSGEGIAMRGEKITVS